MSFMRLFLFTTLAMIAFASNSLLCRAALRDTGIDAASFTFIRIFSGALALWLIMMLRSFRSSPVTRHLSLSAGNWPSAFALFAYAAAFSFAYNTLSAGSGALFFFGAGPGKTTLLWVCRGDRLRANVDG